MKPLMHHQAVFVAVLALNAYPDAPKDIPGNSGALGPSLVDEPSLIDVILHPSDGIDLEITYDLEAVGRVSVAVYVENDETGSLSIILDNTIVADMAFGNGYPTEVEFGQVLYPAGTLMLANTRRLGRFRHPSLRPVVRTRAKGVHRRTVPVVLSSRVEGQNHRLGLDDRQCVDRPVVDTTLATRGITVYTARNRPPITARRTLAGAVAPGHFRICSTTR